jgi:hypothetical protein
MWRPSWIEDVRFAEVEDEGADGVCEVGKQHKDAAWSEQFGCHFKMDGKGQWYAERDPMRGAKKMSMPYLYVHNEAQVIDESPASTWSA